MPWAPHADDKTLSTHVHSAHPASPCIHGALNMKARGAGASVEKIGEAAACAVKRLHLDHRMVQVRCVMRRHACGSVRPDQNNDGFIYTFNGFAQAANTWQAWGGHPFWFSCRPFTPPRRPRRASA